MKQKLSMNLEDVHNPENDEERSYNHIRAWVRDDLRGTYDARLALSRLLAERRVLGEKKAGMQRKIERSTECLRLMKAFDGSLDSTTTVATFAGGTSPGVVSVFQPRL